MISAFFAVRGGVLRGPALGGAIFFSYFIILICSLLTSGFPSWEKKYFVGMEKGCIFASAFAGRTAVEKRA